ncbi:DEAD/DEAH box helicase [Rubinisphaera sp. JC750]|uniref:DEAD/DEAH box helicase n=1 Tax=Rubinisphaera sp. JC750 TaxID=2898658 RepID=UPI001F3CAACF|nr:DEAD/DEAH box helicase [Rubinisphaera sp. JC750]
MRLLFLGGNTLFESTKVTFADLGLSPETVEHLKSVGYEHPSPIQRDFIPPALKGVDCLGQSQTGTGKTAAFMMPVLELLKEQQEEPQALVLCPTRELSEQVAVEAQKISRFSKLEIAVVVGGRPLKAQMQKIERGVDVVVGTPGRVIDLFKRKSLSLKNIRLAVLDEADRMLDIGFRPDMEFILKQCPKERQTLLLSATLPSEVERLANRFMKDPVRIDIAPQNVTADRVEQFYCTVDEHRKLQLLIKLLVQEKPKQAIVFCRTKRKADQLYNKFQTRLDGVETLHGDLPQSKRDRVMKQFRAGKVRMLIATDIVGRGIDVGGISHIINYDIPEHSDDYVHRIGRAGRLSSEFSGRAFTFVTQGQGNELTKIELLVNKLIPEYKLDGLETHTPRERRYV